MNEDFLKAVTEMADRKTAICSDQPGPVLYPNGNERLLLIGTDVTFDDIGPYLSRLIGIATGAIIQGPMETVEGSLVGLWVDGFIIGHAYRSHHEPSTRPSIDTDKLADIIEASLNNGDSIVTMRVLAERIAGEVGRSL